MGDVTVTAWYEPGIGMVEDVSGTPVVKYYHGNLIGTTRFMTDAAGNKTESAVYTAFGERVDGIARRLGYAGAWGYQTGITAGSQPPTSDLPYLHVGYRYYDPESARFLERDPIGLVGALNVYEYVRSRPVTSVDPDGLRSDMGLDEPPGGYPRVKPSPKIPEKVNYSEDDMRNQLEAVKKDIYITCALGNIFSAIAVPVSILIDEATHTGEPGNPAWGGQY